MNARGYLATLEETLTLCLMSHKVQAAVERVELHPRTARFFLREKAGTRHSKIRSLDSELSSALKRPLSIHAGAHGLFVDVQLPPQLWRTLSFGRMLDKTLAHLPEQGDDSALSLLGMGNGGDLMLLNLASPNTPHVLLVGTTGSGKTNLLKAIVAGLTRISTPGRLQLTAIDAKGFSLVAFNDLPHLAHAGQVATGQEDWALAAGRFVLEMKRRLESAGHPPTRPRQVMVIDEAANVLAAHPELAQPLTEIVSQGREVGCHVILSTQRPNADSVSTIITANLPLRIVGACASVQEATLAAGRAGSQAHKLPGRGTFVLVPQGGVMETFTAPLVSSQDIAAIAAYYSGHAATAPADPDPKVISFLDRLRTKFSLGRSPGRPATPPPETAIEQVVTYYHEHGRFPSRRAVGRMIGEIERTKRASDTRAQAALDEATRHVADSQRHKPANPARKSANKAVSMR